MNKPQPFVCVICEVGVFTEWGNNPAPVSEYGKCCDDCNIVAVIPARLKLLKEKP